MGDQDIKKILEKAVSIGSEHVEQGNCASYIPELSKADKHNLGVCILTTGLDKYTMGHTRERFTIQSISKAIP